MPTVKFSGINKEGKTRHFTVTGGCLACIGRGDSGMRQVRERAKGVMPLTAQFRDLVSELSIFLGKEEEWLPYLEPLFTVVKATRTCVTKPIDILRTGMASFDVQNYSYNEVMFAIFHLRSLLNNHCPTNACNGVQGFTGNNYGIEHIRFLMEKCGLSWEAAYTIMLGYYPFNNYPNSAHKGGGDACCFRFEYIPVSTWKQWLAGEYTPNYCNMTLADKFKSGHGYTENIRDMLNGSAKGPKLYTMLKAMYKAAKKPLSDKQTTDLFGKPVKQVATSPDIGEEVMAVFNEYMGKDYA